MILSTILAMALLGQTELPGSKLDNEASEAKATLIVVGKVSNIRGIIGLGAIIFGTLEFEPSTILKGEHKDKIIPRVSYSYSGFEVAPELDKEYLVFIEQDREYVTIVKMLPKTEKNVEAAKKAIQAKKKP